MCPIRRIPIIYSCIIDRNIGHFHDWIRVITIHQSSTLFAKLQEFYSPWNTESKSYQYTTSVAIPNCVKALALLSFCLGVRNQEGVTGICPRGFLRTIVSGFFVSLNQWRFESIEKVLKMTLPNPCDVIYIWAHFLELPPMTKQWCTHHTPSYCIYGEERRQAYM
jgi:hypothetical protein